MDTFMDLVTGFIVLGLLIWGIVYANKKSKERAKETITANGSNRKCLACGFTGQMKTWLGNYGGAQFIAFVLLCFFFIPGLIFIAAFWNKYKCPQCGAINKSTVVGITTGTISATLSNVKKCPMCAEEIQAAAIKCKHCGSMIEV